VDFTIVNLSRCAY